MKKHFLLLVMALMSMASWAVTDIGTLTIRTSSIPYGTPVADIKDYISIYDGEIGGLFTERTYGKDYTWNGIVYSDAKCTKEATGTPLAVGTYYIKVDGMGDYNGSIKSNIVISKKELEVALKWVVTAGSAASTAPLAKVYGAPDPEFTIDWTPAKFVGTDNSSVFTGTPALATHSENVAYTTDGTAVTGVDIALTGLTATNYTVKLATAYAATTGGTAENYGKMTISPKDLSDLSVPAENLAIETTYQGKVINPEFTIKDGTKTLAATTATATGDYSVAYDVAGTGKNANETTPYAVTISGKGNYTGTLSGTVKIKKAPMSVAVKDVKVPYAGIEWTVSSGKITRAKIGSETEAPATAPEFVYYGYVGEDVTKTTPVVPETAPTVAISWPDGTAADKKHAINAATYALTVNVSSSTLDNYTLTALNGTAQSGSLIIEKQKLTVTATTTSKTIGAAEPKIGYTFTGASEYTLQTLKAAVGTTPAVMETEFATEPVFTRAEGEAVGKYAISVKTNGVTSDNFEVAKYVVTEYGEDGKMKAGTPFFEITKATVTVVVMNQEKTYGDADPEALAKPVLGKDFVVTGVTNASVLSGVVLKRTKGEDAGDYELTADFSALGEDFTVTSVPAKFTIKKKDLKVTALGQSMSTGDDATKINQKSFTIDDEKCLATGDVAANVFALTFGPDVNVSGGKLAVPSGETAPLTYASGIVVTLVTTGDDAKGKNYNLTSVAGQLIVVDAAETIILNRVAKADYADETKNDAIKVITDAAKIPTGATAATPYNATFNDFEMLAEKWYPVVLPFDTDVAEIARNFNYAVVNVLNADNTDAKKISFKLHMGKIAANTPFVVKVYGANDKAKNKVNMNTVTFTGKTIVAPKDFEAVTVTDKSGVKFIGTYKGKIDGFRSNEYYFSTAADLNQYYQGNETNTTYLRPLGAYFQVPSNSAARIIEFEEADGTITAIQVARTDNRAANAAEGWYTIGGMKLQGAPTQKGIYIQNGKKVIVK